MAELFVVGRLDGSQNFPGGGSLYCRWKAEYGSAWRLLEGDEVGRTQVDTPADGQRCVWSHPLELHFATKSMQGWPKLVLEVWRLDAFGRHDLYGYGACALPMQPGSHFLTCVCWRPTLSAWQRFSSHIVGGGLHLTEKSIDRFRLKTETMGEVNVSVSLIMRNFDKYGVEL